MIITKQQVAIMLLNYLQHKISIADLESWAENALMDADIQDNDHALICDVLARIGLADVKVFGLTWEDCSEFMKILGYQLKIDAGLVA